MLTSDRALKRYYRQVRQMLPCTRKEKLLLEKQIRANVEDYITEHPQADISAVRAHFGEPQTVAAAYIEATETGELLRQFNLNKKIFCLIACAVLVVLLSWSGVILFAIREARTGDEIAVVELKDGEAISYNARENVYSITDRTGQ